MRKTIGTIIAAAALFAAPQAFAQLTEDIAFDVVNNTDAVITALHITPPNDPSWGRDIAVDYIQPGATMEVDITDDLPGCEYDVRIEFSDGNVMEYGELNLCSINGQTVTIR